MSRRAINMRPGAAVALSLLLASCETLSTSTLPSSFTTENIMKVEQGMSSDEILAMFGEPKNIRAAVCGKSPDQWTCTTWEYGDPIYGHASFTFSGERGSYRLNNYDVKSE
jgi:hypothetical protein